MTTEKQESSMHHPRLARLALTSFLLCLVSPALAIGTSAGIDITNTASASYTDPVNGPQTVNSNTTVLQVDEILDVTITANDAGNAAAMSPDSNRVLSFTLTNTGNGPEVFALSTVSSLGGDNFDPSNVRIYLDNGDNLFNALSDTLHVAGSNDPLLARDTSRRVFVVSDMASALNNSDIGLVRLVAEAVTAQATVGADAPGTTFASQGANGSDAVVGLTQADATGQNGYVISLITTTFTKTSSVLNAFGGSEAIPGATITYTLTFSVAGVGILSGAQVVDPIPANTTYVANSLTLDGNPLTDGAGDDAGLFNTTPTPDQIEVVLGTLGSITAPASYVVTFQVTIN
jgi:uncharacterized repeat protein (TIGR01451 family)